MTAPARRALLLLCAAGLLPTGPAAAQDSATVEVAGAVRQPLRLDARALAAFPAEAHIATSLTRRIDGVDRSSALRGVRLAAVIERAGLDERDRLDWRKAVVLATASDGYRAVFSWPELVNTEGGRQVLLAYERDGAPLDAREGPIALHAPADVRTGPRHVRNLQRLEVRVLRD